MQFSEILLQVSVEVEVMKSLQQLCHLCDQNIPLNPYGKVL